jgi:protein subunit release factor B
MSRELLFSVTKADFDIQTFASGGPGGQHQNKTQSGVRIVHRDSGAVGESRESRSQHQNKEAAFLRLVETSKFKAWHKRRTAELLGTVESVESRVNRIMAAIEAQLGDRHPDECRIEYHDGARWVTL